VKLIVDMNLSPRWVTLLASAGIEARHWSSIGPANATDREIMTIRSRTSIRLPDRTREPKPQSGLDPLQAVRDQAPSFNNAWLKGGEKMPPVQRIGFAIFSLVFCICGVWLAQGAVSSYKDEDRTFLFFAIAGVAFLFLGIAGFRNVLRFRPKQSVK
jgi:Domain of unknown function (DUF5615)